ncbi:MAG: hypothetical protein WDZ40_04495 [Candidatus Spechtbacterales bacterium]
MIKHENIKLIKGSGPVLLSAPHAAPIRKTVQERSYVRMAEKRADELVKTLCEKNGAWGIFTASEEGPLDGWQESIYGKYKKTVKNLIQNEGINLVIDIHGAKKTRPFYIDYDFMIPNKHPHDQYVEKLLCNTFASHFPAEELSNGFYRKIKGSGKKTLTYYVRKYFGIPAIQLEINKTIKESEQKFDKLIHVLYSFITEYENTFTGVQPKEEVLHSKEAR